MNELISSEGHLQKEGKPRSETKCYRTYSVNTDFFKIWSHEMAYVLGFTATDGYVRVNNNAITKPNGSIIKQKGIYQITWSVTDLEVLEYIKKTTKAEHPIKERPISYYKKYKYKNVKKQWYITINSKEMVNDLALLGILPAKSKTIVLPDNYPNEFMSSYIRGIMDGDGCWSLDKAHKKQHPRAFITSGSKEYLTQIGNYLKKQIGIIPKIYTNKRGIHNLSYGGREVAALAYYIMQDNGFMIERKFKKMIETIKGYKQAKCNVCGKPFIHVAGLQKKCKQCKKKLKV